ncbi:hypothetical protein MMC16_005086 [Acarospora aff. strigata]|nr:hypothetical protein [Acarospora aff. strigata]
MAKMTGDEEGGTENPGTLTVMKDEEGLEMIHMTERETTAGGTAQLVPSLIIEGADTTTMTGKDLANVDGAPRIHHHHGLPNYKAYKEETGAIEKAPEVEKQKPNFSNSGKLAAETNTVAGTNIVLKYNEPPEARKPPSKDAWRLYVFKGSDLLETVEIGGRSCWLVGRERMVVDFPVDHPSCSKQHAVIQFRHVVKTNDFGDKDGRVRPYIIDLESANGTMVNGDKIPPSRYLELREKDIVQFGLSSREYVLMLPPAG